MKLLQVLIAVDQLINTILGGYADETISSRAYRMQCKNKFWKYARIIIDCIFFWQKDHKKDGNRAEIIILSALN